MTRHNPLLALALLVPTLAMSSGCEFIDSLNERSGIVDVFTTSQGSPDEQGNMPMHNGHQLVFTNDMGWDVFIDQAYVTTTAVTLLGCDGERFDIEMYWGALAEDLGSTADTTVEGVGGVRATAGNYCDVLVEYSPTQPDDPDVQGTTVLLTGSAVLGDQHVDFMWRSDITVEAEVDISHVESGRPFTISRDQYLPKKLTVSKQYEQFFSGVDFNEELSQNDIDDLLADSLRHGTVAFEGVDVH